MAAQVYIPPIDRAELLADLRAANRDAVKAFVDDVYLGYITLRDLQASLDELAVSHEKWADSCHPDGRGTCTGQLQWWEVSKAC